MIPALRDFHAGKIDTGEFLQQVLADGWKIFSKETLSRLTPLAAIPVGWISNRDPRTNRVIVEGPPAYVQSWDGTKTKIAWAATQVFSAWSMLERDVERTYSDPQALPGAAGVALSVLMHKADPRGSLIYKVDPDTLSLQADYEQTSRHLPLEEQKKARMRTAEGQMMAGNPAPFQGEMQDMGAHLERGIMPPDFTEDSPLDRLMALVRERLKMASTREERNALRLNQRDLKRLQAMDALERLQKAHPSSALQGMQDRAGDTP
jgi:hypothetical protein